MLSFDLQYYTVRTLQRTLLPVSLEVLKSEDGAPRQARHFFFLFFPFLIESNHPALFLWEPCPCNPAVAVLLQYFCSSVEVLLQLW
jgi:hypothetical protein